mmetsp:Transcript_102260/g.228456  ORF Transcript_102260/g.228456 Transcript_102260/m.228456 type:complete len:393 (+) Transcript_102260:78-1256(+)
MCCKSLGCCCKIYAYFALSIYINYKGVWRWANEWDIECEHPPLPVNQSGVKVLLAGWAKSGTWTLSHALGKLGYNAYHSQEFNFHVWSPIADEYWMRPENGGRRSKNSVLWTLPFVFTPNENPVSLPFPQDDLQVLRELKPQTLAQRISKCRVDTIALDGIDPLHEPVLDVSPDAKVVMLDWRSHAEWTTSMEKQEVRQPATMFVMEFFYSSLHFLPWGLLVKAVDPFINNDIEKLLKNGAPPFIQKCPLGVMLWHPFAKNRQIYSHWFMGLGGTTLEINETRYNSLFERIRQRVLANNILNWDFKTKGWDELCAFLDIKDCPEKGKMKTEPNTYTDLLKNGGRGWENNCDEPAVFIPMYLVFHWINWKVFTIVFFTLPGHLCRRSVRAKTD